MKYIKYILAVFISALTINSCKMDLDLTNPNQLSVKLSGLDYNLLLDNHNFLNGEQKEEVFIESLQKSSIKIPIHLNFKEIYESYQTLGSKDSVVYDKCTRDRSKHRENSSYRQYRLQMSH